MDAGEVNRAFRDWTVAEANDEELVEMLRHLCSEAIANDYIRERQVIRGITINHIQMARTIAALETTLHKLNAANDRTQKLVVVLTVVAVVVGVIQVAVAIWH